MTIMAIPNNNVVASSYHADDFDGNNNSSMETTIGQAPAIELETLTEGLLLLTEFASLDSLAYQTSFAFPTAASPNPGHGLSLQEEKHQRTLRRLEQMLVRKDVRATQLPALWRALHRLHSNLAILQENEARHAMEVKGLRDDLKKSKRETAKLHKAKKALADQNSTLKLKLQEKRSLLKQARDFFRNSQELQKDLEQQNTAFKLQAHEQFLSSTHSASTRQEQFLLQSSRERLESTDSNFSDADALLFPDTSLPEVLASGGASARSAAPEEEEDTVSLHSAHSACSLITDDGVPVLKLFAHDDVMTSSTTVNSSHVSDMSEGSDEALAHSLSFNLPGGPLKHPASPCTPGVYRLWFQHGHSVGLRFQTIPLSEVPQPPKGVLTQEFLKDDVDADEDKKEGFRLPSILGRQSPVPTIGNRSRANSESKDDTPKIKGHAFVVSAYDKKAAHHDQPRPTLGARVVEINGQPVDPEWSMRRFLHVLSAASGADVSTSERKPSAADAGGDEEDDKPHEIVTDEVSVVSSIDDKKRALTFSIGFRNDALAKKHRDRLSSSDRSEKGKENNREQHHHAEPTVVKNLPPKAPQPEHKAFGLGFLRLGGKGNGDADAKPAQDTKITVKAKEVPASGPAIHPKGKNPLFFWDRGDSKPPRHEQHKKPPRPKTPDNQQATVKTPTTSKPSPEEGNEFSKALDGVQASTDKEHKECEPQDEEEQVRPEALSVAKVDSETPPAAKQETIARSSVKVKEAAEKMQQSKHSDSYNTPQRKADVDNKDECNVPRDETKEAEGRDEQIDSAGTASASEDNKKDTSEDKQEDSPDEPSTGEDKRGSRQFGIPFWRTSPKPTLEKPTVRADEETHTVEPPL